MISQKHLKILQKLANHHHSSARSDSGESDDGTDAYFRSNAFASTFTSAFASTRTLPEPFRGEAGSGARQLEWVVDCMNAGNLPMMMDECGGGSVSDSNLSSIVHILRSDQSDSTHTTTLRAISPSILLKRVPADTTNESSKGTLSSDASGTNQLVSKLLEIYKTDPARKAKMDSFAQKLARV